MKLCGFEVGLDRPLFLIAGPCVVESEQLQMDVAGQLKEIAAALSVPFIFKSSYDKANRSSGTSFRGPGLDKGLEILAKVKRELQVPIVALSQLSRAPETRSDHRPQLSDLRESGALEQDADVVMFIFREEIYDAKPENAGQAEIIVAKHRSGPTGSSSRAHPGRTPAEETRWSAGSSRAAWPSPSTARRASST